MLVRNVGHENEDRQPDHVIASSIGQKPAGEKREEKRKKKTKQLDVVGLLFLHRAEIPETACAPNSAGKVL